MAIRAGLGLSSDWGFPGVNEAVKFIQDFMDNLVQVQDNVVN